VYPSISLELKEIIQTDKRSSPAREKISDVFPTPGGPLKR